MDTLSLASQILAQQQSAQDLPVTPTSRVVACTKGDITRLEGMITNPVHEGKGVERRSRGLSVNQCGILRASGGDQ
jgi:hypothetical protein